MLAGPLPEITAAYWDAARRALVLIGPDGANGPLELVSVGLQLDHFVVALRAAISGEHIGVSIDPPAEYRDGVLRGEFPPDGSPMYVSYLGNTAGTLFGAIMFEADRVMKCLSKGTDNVSRAALRATKVAGYRTLFDLFNHFQSGGSGSWFRFWFVIDIVEIAYDESSKGLRFGRVGMKVLNETELAEGSKAPQDPACAAFAQHLTENYDLYANEFPIFARLKELAKISALARFLVNSGVEIDPHTIFGQPINAVSTPETTPGIRVSSHSRNGGVQSLYGGVDMTVDPTIVNMSDLPARSTQEAAAAACPGDFSTTWTFDTAEQHMRALSLRLGRVRKPYRALASSDHAFRESWRDSVRSVQRYYDSSSAGGDFGPGWWLFLPYRLEVPGPRVKRHEVRLRSEEPRGEEPTVVMLRDFVSSGTKLYRRYKDADSDAGLAYCRVTSQQIAKGSVTFSVEGSDIIYRRGHGYYRSDGRYTFTFDTQGRLSEVRTREGVLVRYKWAGTFLQAIDCGDGGSYELQYDHTAGTPRIADIIASDGTKLSYAYNERGLLQECWRAAALKVSYRYDARLRLTETRDRDGAIVGRNSYDSNDNVVTGAQNTARLANGTFLHQEFVAGRPSIVRDDDGSSATYRYWNDGGLESVAGRTQTGSHWATEYDQTGRMTSVEDQAGVRHAISYHSDRQVSRIENSLGSWTQFPEPGERIGRISGFDANVGPWSATLNEIGLPDAIHDSAGRKHVFRYGPNGLKSIRSPGWSLDVSIRDGTLDLRTKSDTGVKQKLTVNGRDNKAQLEINGPENDIRRISIDTNACLIEDCAGTADCHYEEKTLTCVFNFTY